MSVDDGGPAFGQVVELRSSPQEVMFDFDKAWCMKLTPNV